MKEPNNILVRMPNWIGDVVMATPLLHDIKARFPKAKLTVMCLHPIVEVLEKDPVIDAIFSFRKGNRNAAVAYLRANKFDLGILTTNSFSSAWLFFQGKVKNRIGFQGDGRSFLLSKALPFPEMRKSQHLVKTYKSLLSPLGIAISQTKPQLFVDGKELASAEQLLAEYGVEKGDQLIGINPCAAFGSAKCWLPERFRELAQKLVADNAKVVFFGTKDCKELVDGICTGLQVINLVGATSLRELLAITSLCDLFITNDSGPMHIADALDVNLVAIFGSTCPVATGPYNTGDVLRKQVECSPCFKRECPIDFRCMTRITVDDVYQQARRKLGCLQPSLTH